MSIAAFLAFTQATPLVHAGIEWSAYFVGARVFFLRRPTEGPTLRGIDLLGVLACTIFGAAAGGIALHDVESFRWVSSQPMTSWITGKSVLGGFLGGTLGAEVGKRIVGWRRSTGDRWVLPLLVGLMIGRVGCQLSGPWDMTYGSPTGTTFGWDYGDGIPRYPTALIEIVAVIALWLAIRRVLWSRPGQLFNAFLLGYCVLRFLVDFLKPPFGGEPIAGTIPIDLFHGLTAIQWTALLGAGWMGYRMRPSTEREA